MRLKCTSPESVTSVRGLREWMSEPFGSCAKSTRSRVLRAFPIASTQQLRAIVLACDSNASKPSGEAASNSENADSNAAKAPGTVLFILGLPFFESNSPRGKGDSPSTQTNKIFTPVDSPIP